MKKKVMMISFFYEPYYMKNARCDFISKSGCQWRPIFLAQIGAYLEQHGHDVFIIDAQAYGLSYEEVEKTYMYYNPDNLLVYPGRISLKNDRKLTNRLINKKRCSFAYCGPYAYLMHKDLYPSYTFRGLAEKSIKTWIENGVFSQTPLTQKEFDSMPYVSNFFDRHIEKEYYAAPSEPYPFIETTTSRGCYWGKCSYCLWPITCYDGYLERKIEDVKAEIDYIDQMGHKHIFFQDDSMPLPRALEIADHIQKYKITWSCYMRPFVADNKVFQKLKKGNLLNIHSGFESGNDNTLKDINKGIDALTMKNFANLTHKSGLKVHADFMIGIDKTEEDINKTIDFACKLPVHSAQFQVYIPFFGNKSKISPLKLEKLAKKAYWKFYSHPKRYHLLLEQIKKPKIIKRSLQSLWK